MQIDRIPEICTRLSAIEGTLDVAINALYFLTIKVNRMATKQEVLDAIAAERAEVKARVDELLVMVQTLTDQITAGAGAPTAADMDEIKLAVQGIITPTAPAPAPTPGLPDTF